MQVASEPNKTLGSVDASTPDKLEWCEVLSVLLRLRALR